MVTETLSDMIQIKGVDMDSDQVQMASNRGLVVNREDGNALSYPDSVFDLVICSFYLMWVKDKSRALKEMIRVSSDKVIILAEPIWSMTMKEPRELRDLMFKSMEKIKHEGGDPDAGLEILNLVRRMGIEHRYGTIPMDTSPEETLMNVRAEAEINGITVDVPEPILFNVPFIWIVMDFS
jgi:ubiquinone/menaquinone biosynthesis C-methylase UbiE